ncbi:MAG: hypothetical protein O2970_11470 [Proteobacteria bacterium]|nr:hypothetical protein [Pseudomonadota bacterium]
MKRNEVMNFKVTEDEKDRIKQMAVARGQDVSSFIRERIFGEDESPIIINTRLSKYEDDMITNMMNNTILIRHLVDKGGDTEVIKRAQDTVKQWKDKRYKQEGA